MKKIFIIDGMALIYRAHFAMIKNPLITKTGQHTSAIYGFANSIIKIIKDEKPDFFVIALDTRKPTFRHEMYPEYKQNRERMPDELSEQIEPILTMIDLMGIKSISMDGYEADDIIGTLTKTASESDIEAYIVSGDKDMMQLVDSTTYVYSLGNRFKPTTVYDKDKVFEKYGVQPDMMIDWLALVGDKSDNVPGIEGVGPKTATKLLEEFGSYGEVFNNHDKIKNTRISERVMQARDTSSLSYDLVTIKRDLELGINIDSYIISNNNISDLITFFDGYEIYNISQKLEKIYEVSIDRSADNRIDNDKSYTTIYDFNQLDEFISTLKVDKLISIDLETTSLDYLSCDVVGISFSLDPHAGYYIPILRPSDTQDSNPFTFDGVIDRLLRVLSSGDYNFCGQNIKFDYLVLKNNGIELKNIVSDSMIAESLLHPESNSYKLESLALDYLSHRMVPIEDLIGYGKDQISMDKVPIDKISTYACEDSDIALQVNLLQEKELEKKNIKGVYDSIEMPLISVLAKMELNGVFIDTSVLSNLSTEIKSRMTDIESRIYMLAGHEFNINSPMQLADVLFDELKLKTVQKRSTAINVLEALKDDHPLPEEVLEFRHLAKLKSTYIDALPRYIHSSTGRVHSSFNQAIASTGRLSSTSPNFQNIPIRTDLGKEIRRAFIAQQESSHIFSADYSQVELRIMADFSQEPVLIDAFNNGIDIHSKTASLINNIDLNQVTANQRRIAKVVNFGIMYGAGPYRISQELKISMKEAKEIIDNYFDTYPKISNYISSSLNKAREDGYVKTINGRRRNLVNIRSSNKNLVRADERIAINMPIQGTAAELIKIAMINIQEKIEVMNLETKLILQVHDELILEVPENEKKVVSEMVVEEMESALKISVPLKVDSSFGCSWFEAH